MSLELAQAETAKAVNRLKRAQGQLAAVIRMMEEGRDCEDIVTQLAAVSRAIDRAGFSVIASGMRHCLAAEATDAEGSAADVARLEKVFLSLA